QSPLLPKPARRHSQTGNAVSFTTNNTNEPTTTTTTTTTQRPSARTYTYSLHWLSERGGGGEEHLREDKNPPTGHVSRICKPVRLASIVLLSPAQPSPETNPHIPPRPSIEVLIYI